MCCLAFGEIVKQRRTIARRLSVILVKLFTGRPVRSFTFLNTSLYFLGLANQNILLPGYFAGSIQFGLGGLLLGRWLICH